MRSAFLGLNIASQGLFTAKAALNITNHNISNATTEGYSRQVGVQKATRPLAANNGKGMIGTGSDIIGINQVRDYYLDVKYWNENATLGQHSVKSTQMGQMEALFSEPSEHGFNKAMNDFFESMDTLSNDAGDDASRASVRQVAISFTQYFNSTAESLKKIQRDTNFSVKVKVDEINSIGSQLQSLNRQIFKSELDGSTANDLRDERARMVDKLSKIINVEVNENPENKHYTVKINGQVLVSHYDANKLVTKPRNPKANAEDVEGLYDIQWENGLHFDTNSPKLSGELKGYIDLRDGNNMGASGSTHQVNYKGIPYYVHRLDQFVRTFAKAMNEGKDIQDKPLTTIGHTGGYSANGTTGNYFFAWKDQAGVAKGKDEVLDYTKITASNFSLSKEILDDPRNIAASSNSNPAQSDNQILRQIISLKHNPKMFREGEPGNYIQAIIGELGIDSKQAKVFEKHQTNITKVVENQRMSVSGVNLDEEMANMVKFQQAYGAAAKIMTVIDQIYDTTINRMGSF